MTLGDILRDLDRQVPRKILVIEQIDTGKKDRTMPTDDDKLKEAIRRVRSYRHGNSTFMIDGAEPTTNACIDMVLAAAESTLLAPIMPPKPTSEMIAEMVHVVPTFVDDAGIVAQHLYASIYRHLTKPKAKTVEVWRVESALLMGEEWRPCCTTHLSLGAAETSARALRNDVANRFSCIQVIGPLSQKVPA